MIQKAYNDVVEAQGTVANVFSRGILSTSRSNDKRRLIVGCFNHATEVFIATKCWAEPVLCS